MYLVVLGALLLICGGAGICMGYLAQLGKLSAFGKFTELGDYFTITFIVVGAIIAVIGLIMLIIGIVKKPRIKTRQLVESALMVAVATVLSLVKIDLPFGGGVTLVSMLPLILISHRYGAGWGVFTAFVYSVIQLIFGLDNVGYATNAVMAVGIIMLDYVLAYTVIGLSGMFGKSRASVAVGICFTFVLRFLCHYIAGAWIWGEWMPEKFMGMTMTNPWIYSALYNGWYMLVELIVTMIVAMLIYKPLEKFFRGTDLKNAKKDEKKA